MGQSCLADTFRGFQCGGEQEQELRGGPVTSTLGSARMTKSSLCFRALFQLFWGFSKKPGDMEFVSSH